MAYTPRRILACAIAGGLLCSPAVQGQNGAAGPPEMPPPRAIPGLTTDDLFPSACVDCHLNYPEMGMDTRLSSVLAAWAETVDPVVLQVAQGLAVPAQSLRGVHPRVELAQERIPGVCLECHADGAGKVLPLVPFLHKVHLADTGPSVYLRVFQGECTHCHKFDKGTGEWQVPDATEPDKVSAE